MKARVHKRPEAEILKEFPIRGEVPGWYYRITERNAGAFQLEGTDAWGRTVTLSGTDPDALRERAEQQAARISDASDE